MKYFIRWCCLFNLVLGLHLANAQAGYPPPCDKAKQVKLDTDQNKRLILIDFIRNCVGKYWLNDKGIVLLREYRNEEGKLCWLLLPSIDDSYKDNPPSRFASFDGDIILVFDADSKQNIKSTVVDKTDLNQCLEQIIGDRVYTRPLVKSRWTDMVLPFTNRKMKEGAHRHALGNGGSLIIIFNPDGSYEKLLPI